MQQKFLHLATAISSLLLVGLVVAYIVSGSLNSRRQFVTLSPTMHISMDRQDANAQFYVFNDVNTGPFMDGIVGVSVPVWNQRLPDPVLNVDRRIGAMRFRMVRWRNGKMLQTLAVKMYLPLAISSILPITWLMRVFSRPSRKRGFPVTTFRPNG